MEERVDDLRLIKKYYGEKMSHLCKELFPTILETPGLLYDTLYSNFDHNKFLYDDLFVCKMLDDFKNYIYSLVGIEVEKIVTDKTPKELLDEVGYILYECHSEDEIQSFKKYYSPGEELCTFDGGRLNRCYVFFAVKKDVDLIKRSDFNDPHRQDLYGTSVISIQFSRGSVNTLSIKNRYNHTLDRIMENPDATFSNNLENIIGGLTDSFEKVYDFHIDSYDKFSLEIPGYVRANDGRYYKYNYEIHDIYYCMNNVIINKDVVVNDYFDKSRFIIFDYFVIDLKEKKVFLYDEKIKDSFVDGLSHINSVDININDCGNKVIKLDNAFIEIDSQFRLVGYSNDSLRRIGNQFLLHDNFLKYLDLANVLEIGDTCLPFNESISDINLPKVNVIGSSFLVSRKYTQKPYGVINVPNNYTYGFNSIDLLDVSGFKK